MAPLRFPDHPAHLKALRRAALEAADAGAAVERHLRLQGATLRVGSDRVRLSPTSHVYLVALGKAALAMAEAARSILGARLTAGVVTALARPSSTTRALRSLRGDERLQVIPAGHPLPDEGSLAAGKAAASMLQAAGPEDVLLALVSGGGSAMFELLPPGIGLEELRRLNEALLRSGALIEEVNAARRALSYVKAGGLARLAAPALTVGLILSDVAGDQLSVVSSGPTVLRRADRAAARRILKTYTLWTRAPRAVPRALGAAEWPQAKLRAAVPRPINLLVGSNRDVVKAVARQAEAMGFVVRILTRRMRGEARGAGELLARRLLRAPRPACLLMGGETTVTVRNGGRGGRNQELALGAALVLEGTPGLAVMALATDGIDGPTDAAGAIVTGETARRARVLGLDPQRALARHDSYPLLNACQALIRTGPTGTNLGDLVVGLGYAPDGQADDWSLPTSG
ncbi:MAG: DUF4147 domain-containing protein [Chloroflexota bacterium]